MNTNPKFCPECGEQLKLSVCDGRLRPICQSCGQIVYLNPLPSVAAILSLEGRVLLVRRNIEPGLGAWSLPGGFIEIGETVEEAMIREVHEETGIMSRPLNVVGVQSHLAGFYGDVIVVCYEAEQVSGSLKPGGDADQASFFEYDALPPIAFQVHRRFIGQYSTRHGKLKEV